MPATMKPAAPTATTGGTVPVLPATRLQAELWSAFHRTRGMPFQTALPPLPAASRDPSLMTATAVKLASVIV